LSDEDKQEKKRRIEQNGSTASSLSQDRGSPLNRQKTDEMNKVSRLPFFPRN
jgi:hypothetical protein